MTGPQVIHLDFQADAAPWLAALAEMSRLADLAPDGWAQVDAALRGWRDDGTGDWMEWRERVVSGGLVVLEMHPGPGARRLLAELAQAGKGRVA